MGAVWRRMQGGTCELLHESACAWLIEVNQVTQAKTVFHYPHAGKSVIRGDDEFAMSRWKKLRHVTPMLKSFQQLSMRA